MLLTMSLTKEIFSQRRPREHLTCITSMLTHPPQRPLPRSDPGSDRVLLKESRVRTRVGTPDLGRILAIRASQEEELACICSLHIWCSSDAKGKGRSRPNPTGAIGAVNTRGRKHGSLKTLQITESLGVKLSTAPSGPPNSVCYWSGEHKLCTHKHARPGPPT